MVDWKDQVFCNNLGKIAVPAITFEDACSIIREYAKKGKYIAYFELMAELKNRNHRKIYRGNIGNIVGEVSDQISLITNPSIYPSSIVVHKGSKNTGTGFWTLEEGTTPPSKIPIKNRKMALSTYQSDVFQKPW